MNTHQIMRRSQRIVRASIFLPVSSSAVEARALSLIKQFANTALIAPRLAPIQIALGGFSSRCRLSVDWGRLHAPLSNRPLFSQAIQDVLAEKTNSFPSADALIPIIVGLIADFFRSIVAVVHVDQRKRGSLSWVTNLLSRTTK